MNRIQNNFLNNYTGIQGLTNSQNLCPETRLFHSTVISPASSKSLDCWKWTKRIGLGLVGAVGVLALGGALYQILGTQIDAVRYPPIGKLVDVGGHNMHLYTTGKGGPSVILDAGMGCDTLGWSLVQPKIAEFTQVTSFDRPGYGWSDESLLERTSQNIVTELHAALQKAEILPPYVMVGHSFGGLNARLFASLYPEEVLGVVLVDSAHEDQMEKIPMPQINHNLMMLASHLGLIRLVTHYPSAYRKELLEVLPEEVQNQLIAKVSTTKFIRSVLQEASNLGTSCKQVKEAGGHLGDKPLIVISANKTTSAEGSGYTQEEMDAILIPFKELQKDLANKSTHSKQIFSDSDHMVTLHDPKIIVDSVRELVEPAKGGA